MEIISGLYLVGYFISFGIAFGYKEEKDSWVETLGFAFFIGILSWINIGIIIGDFCRIHLKGKEITTKALTPKTSTDDTVNG